MKNDPSIPEPVRLRAFRVALVTIVAAAVVSAFGFAFLVTIMERKQEAKNPFFRVVELDDRTEDPALWGKNFPIQYDDYRRTVDQTRTKYGGSEAMPRTPTDADPRSIVAQSKLEEDPRLKILWAGFPFSVDTREDRGHAYMLEDQSFTARQHVVSQPGSCMHCHSSVYVPYMKLGDGDLMKGFATMNAMPWAEARQHVQHPITCIDCHDSQTMALRITRPAFIMGIRALKAAQGVKDYDVNRDATRQELRSFVCAQCHVEYYFKGPEKQLVYPWAKGLQAEAQLAYYDEVGHWDWRHAETGAPVLKAQHPEFELWSQGIHARSGVACVDCHMPYKRVGATKITDHHTRSPLLNVSHACQTCHKWPEAELQARVEIIQDRTFQLRQAAMDAVMDLIADLKLARASGLATNDPALLRAQDFHRRAQWYLDFVEAENSMGFHAPQEAARLLAEAINHARKGQIAIRDRP